MAAAAQTGPILDPQLAAARFLRDVRPLEEHRLAFEAAGVRLLRLEYPVIEVALLWKAKNSEVILHVEAPDYDYLPPMAWWIDASGAPLREGRGLVPSGDGFQQTGGHPHGLSRTWLCFPGWREYHDHPGHQSPSWRSQRAVPDRRLPGILLRTWTDLQRPGVQGA